MTGFLNPYFHYLITGEYMQLQNDVTFIFIIIIILILLGKIKNKRKRKKSGEGGGGRKRDYLNSPPPLPKKTSSTEGETLKPITNSSALLDLNYLLPMRNTPKMELQAVSRQPGAVENQASTHDVYSSVALKTLLLLKVLYIITSVPCTPWIHVYLQGFLGNT